MRIFGVPWPVLTRDISALIACHHRNVSTGRHSSFRHRRCGHRCRIFATLQMDVGRTNSSALRRHTQSMWPTHRYHQWQFLAQHSARPTDCSRCSALRRHTRSMWPTHRYHQSQFLAQHSARPTDCSRCSSSSLCGTAGIMVLATQHSERCSTRIRIIR